MPYFSSEVINKIRNIDLLTYLKNNEPEELVCINKDNYCTKTHDSLKISNGLWYWFSRGIGGKSALDYLVKVKDYSFTDAIQKLLVEYDINNIPKTNYVSKQTCEDFTLPEKSINNEEVIKYLQKRGISLELICECIDNKILYQDTKNNAVFVGYDINGKARFASIRATNSTRFMHEAYGSNKAFSFQISNISDAESIHVFESAIDLLSYITLIRMDKKDITSNFLSLAGIYQPAQIIEQSKIPLALNFYLNQHPKTKKIVLHLDNDIAGRRATIALQNAIPKQYEVINSPPPSGKDYNDFLRYIISKNINKGER